MVSRIRKSTAPGTSTLAKIDVRAMLDQMARLDDLLTPAERRERMLRQLEADFGCAPCYRPSRRSA